MNQSQIKRYKILAKMSFHDDHAQEEMLKILQEAENDDELHQAIKEIDNELRLESLEDL